MKYKVIGWVSYDDDEFEESEQTYAKNPKKTNNFQPLRIML